MAGSGIYIAVGSNIEPECNVPAAVDRLAESVEVAAVSTFYWSAPLDRPGQPRFMNGVLRIRTDLEPRPLKFDILRAIEAQLGRVRGSDRYADRTIDLDIALFGERVVDEEGLRIPDPDVGTRPFIAIPLLELAPDLILPDTGARLAGLPAAVDRSGLIEATEMKSLLEQRIQT